MELYGYFVEDFTVLHWNNIAAKLTGFLLRFKFQKLAKKKKKKKKNRTCFCGYNDKYSSVLINHSKMVPKCVGTILTTGGIQDFVGEGVNLRLWGEGEVNQPPTQALFGKNVCKNERIGSG